LEQSVRFMSVESMDLHPKHLSACSGIGAIDLGLQAALGALTVGYIERDAFAAAILVARMEEQTLDRAPIWDDLTTFNSTDWSGCVDIISAGIPCQPFSYAGKHGGTADDRWLWPHIYRISQDCRPCQIFIENTPGLVERGLYEVLFDLAKMGYSAEWGLFNASDAQAPHKRQRLFLLAHREDIDIRPWARRVATLRSIAMGYANSEHVEGSGSKYRLGAEKGRQAKPSTFSSSLMADSHSVNTFKTGNRETGSLEVQSWHDSYGCFPPARDDTEGWDRWNESGSPQPTVRGDSHGAAYRVDRLRSLGNSAVPQCVTLAYNILLGRLISEPIPVK
jgi:DNA (cytosine-5)-methyltransferase 1